MPRHHRAETNAHEIGVLPVRQHVFSTNSDAYPPMSTLDCGISYYGASLSTHEAKKIECETLDFSIGGGAESPLG